MISDITVDSLMTLMEAGANRSSLERGQLLLVWGYREQGWQELAALSLGRRARCLLDLRRSFFGKDVTLSGHCRRCGASFEFATDVDEILSADNRTESVRVKVPVGDLELEARPLTAPDIAAFPDLDSDQEKCAYLAFQSLVAVRKTDGTVLEVSDPAQMQPDWVAALGGILEDQDPLSSIVFCLDCADCGNSWRAHFDIADLLWEELESEHAMVLEEIHLLARHYGWTEADIVAIPPVRRRAYARHLMGGGTDG